MQLYGDDLLHGALQSGAEATDLEGLGGEALDLARRAVGASSALLFEFDHAGLRGRGGALSERFSAYPAELAGTDVIQSAARRSGHIPTPVIVNGWSSFDRAAHRQSAAYGDFYRPAGIEQILCIHLNRQPFGAPGLVGILLSRSHREPEFAQRDLDAARACAAVFRGSLQRFAAARTGPVEVALPRQQAPLLVADARGKLAFISPEAEVLLRPGGGIPSPLAEAMAAYRAFLDGETLLPARQRVVLRLEAPGATVTCDLFAVRAPSGERLVGARLAGQQPDRVAIAAARFGLTRTESAVLASLVEGQKNATIAASMAVSVETIRTHVQRILRKLGVRSRTAAAHKVLSAP